MKIVAVYLYLISTLRIIKEQTGERNTSLYVIFIDFEKALDSIKEKVYGMSYINPQYLRRY